MKNVTRTLLFIFCALSTLAHADYTSPASSANPPESIGQDPSVPSNPNIYPPAKPIAPPSGTLITPTTPTPAPMPSTPNTTQPSAMNQQPTMNKVTMQNTETSNTQAGCSDASTNTKPADASTNNKNSTPPSTENDNKTDSMDGSTIHDPDPEAEDVGTAPNQAS